MLRRITDIWPKLLGLPPNEDEEEGEGLLANQDGAEDSRKGLTINEDELLELHRHLYWSRLVSVRAFEVDLMRMWPLGPDVVEECQAVAALP